MAEILSNLHLGFSSIREPRGLSQKVPEFILREETFSLGALLGIETAARRNWEVSPKSSSLGNPEVARYVAVTSSIDFCQATNVFVGSPHPDPSWHRTTGSWQPAAGNCYSLYLAVVVSVSNTVTSFTRTRPLVTLFNRVFDSS
jgi:hypothetical protein